MPKYLITETVQYEVEAEGETEALEIYLEVCGDADPDEVKFLGVIEREVDRA